MLTYVYFIFRNEIINKSGFNMERNLFLRDLFANCLKIGEVFIFSLRQDILIFDDVHSSACNIGHFLGQAFSGIFFCFLKCIEKELQI
jgi:hypothetical protein